MRLLLCLLTLAIFQQKSSAAEHPLLAPETIAQGKICGKWMNHKPLTKVVAALNPNKGDDSDVAKVLGLGVDVARLNMSHIALKAAIPTLHKTARAAKLAGRTVGILYDLPGPKLRIGKLPTETAYSMEGVTTIQLFKGSEVAEGAFMNAQTIRLPLPAWIFESLFPTSGALLKTNDRVLFDDGKLQTKVVSVTASQMTLQVDKASSGVALRSRLGVDFPDSDLRIPALQELDRQLILAGLITGRVHKIALSFVRDAGDIVAARALVAQYLAFLKRVKAGDLPDAQATIWKDVAAVMPEGTEGQAPTEWLQTALKGTSLVTPEIDAKIERREAVLAIDEILEQADGVMVARGDLIMAVGSHNLLMAQSKIVRAAQERRKPVIVATGLLSGVSNGVVPHSSAIDVGAVTMLFADAAQLSNESVIGDPFEAIPQLRLHLSGGEIAAFDSPLTPNFDTKNPTVQFTNQPEAVVLPSVTSSGHYVLTQNSHLAGLLSFRRAVRVIQVSAPPPRGADKAWYRKQIEAAGYSVTDISI